ncbi:MAG TPA: hypothetical protein VFE33_25200 [Thermoanaerobaculia bacterium]|nr:hypothetical protein [Thermoanaerobaculia bacterium]
MRRKFSTLLEESLVDRTRSEAIRQGKQIADVVGDALASYLDGKAAAFGPQGVVAKSWGVLPMPAQQVRELLAQEDELLDG